MNKLYYVTIIWMIVMLVTCNPVKAQSKNKVDTTIQLSDTTHFISIGDLYRYADTFKDKTTGRQWEVFSQIFNAIIQSSISEWNEKHKKKP